MNNEPDPRLDEHGRPLPATACPNCGKVLDAATSYQGDEFRPRPTDITVCIWCASVLQFSEGMTLQAVDLDAIGADDDIKVEVRHVQQAIRRLRGV